MRGLSVSPIRSVAGVGQQIDLPGILTFKFDRVIVLLDFRYHSLHCSVVIIQISLFD